MYFVYVLYSENYDKIYICMTSNLEQRLLSHNELSKKGWTIKFRPWEMVYKESFQTKQEALKREKELKSFRGREFIRNQIIGKIS
ncbi:MAG TPA: GIY-YIG nuclease family protein [Ignavibacteria bacterium]|nr:GIY-YIG nuclease family protein [Ignavibacteria bacterium]